jgi:hypothetical protein
LCTQTISLWSVELGKIDIATEVSMLVAYSVAPQ